MFSQDIYEKFTPSDTSFDWRSTQNSATIIAEPTEAMKKIVEGEILLGEEDYTMALHYLLSARELGFQDALMWYEIGVCYINLDRGSDGFEAFSESYLAGSWLERKNDCFFRKEAYVKVLDNYVSVQNVMHNRYKFHSALEAAGDCLMMQKQYEDAIDTYKLAESNYVKYVSYYPSLRIGMCYMFIAQYESALTYFNKALFVHGTTKLEEGIIYNFKGWTYWYMEDYRACYCFKKAYENGFFESKEAIDRYCQKE